MSFNPPLTLATNELANSCLRETVKPCDCRLRIKRVQRPYFPHLLVGHLACLFVVNAVIVYSDVASILPLAAQVEMSRVDALAASDVSSLVQKFAVVKNIFRGDGSEVKQPARPMCQNHRHCVIAPHKSGSDNSVTMPVECPGPYPAAISDEYFAEKPFWKGAVKSLRQRRVLANVTHSKVPLPVWGATQRAF